MRPKSAHTGSRASEAGQHFTNSGTKLFSHINRHTDEPDIYMNIIHDDVPTASVQRPTNSSYFDFGENIEIKARCGGQRQQQR